MGNAQGASRSPKPALQGPSPWLPASGAVGHLASPPASKAGWSERSAMGVRLVPAPPWRDDRVARCQLGKLRLARRALREFDPLSLLHQVRDGAVGHLASPPALKAGKSERSALSVRLAPAPQATSGHGELLERQQASLLNWSRWREPRAGSTPALSSESRTAGSASGKLAVCKTATVGPNPTPASKPGQAFQRIILLFDREHCRWFY
jgi:hypothetical protein